MLFVDKAMTLDMFAQIKGSAAFDYLVDASSDPAMWKLPEARAAFTDLLARLCALPEESQAMQKFVKDVRAAIGKLPTGAAPSEFLRTYDQVYLRLIEEHQEVREMTQVVLSHLCATMDGGVLGCREFVEEFHAARGEHAPRPRLTEALEFGSCLKMMSGLQFVFEDDNTELFELQVANDLAVPATVVEVSIAGANDLLKALPVVPGVCMVKSIVDGSATALCSTAVSEAGVSALRLPPTSLKEKSVVELIASLVDIKKKPGMVAATWLEMGDGSVWPGDRSKDVAIEIVNDMVARSMKVDVRGLCRPGALTTMTAMENPGQIPAILQALTDIGKVSSLLGHFHKNATCSAPFTQDAIVLPEVDKAMRMIGHFLDTAAKACSTLNLDGNEDVPWVFPLDKIPLWVKAARHVETALQRMIISEAVAKTRADAKEVQGNLPPSYESLFREPAFNLLLAAESLVEWPSREQLNKGCNGLFNKLHEVSRTWTKWGGSPGVLLDPEWKSDLKASHDILENARKALRTIAGVNCLHNLTGQTRLEAAKKILQKKDMLPKYLAAALEKLR